MKWLLDTCVISELVTKNPNEKVVEWIDSVEPDHVCLTVITIGEIRKGIEKLVDSKKKQRLYTWLMEGLLLRFQERIIPIDIDVVLVWGALVGRLEKEGKTMGAVDALIGATALSHDLVLVTRNSSDFVNSGLNQINPWQ